jgi:hypothetical protein
MYKQSLYASLALAMLTTTSFSDEVKNETKKLEDIVISTSKSDKSIKDLQGAVKVSKMFW